MKKLALTLILTFVAALVAASPAQALSTPSQPAAVPVAQTVYVSWNGVTGATSYRLLRSTLLRTGSWSSDTTVYEGVSTVYVDAGRDPMTTYRYKARAQNPSENSPYSTYGLAAVPPFSTTSPWNAPATPTGGTLSSTQLADLGSGGLAATGAPGATTFGSPVYFGAAGDPTTTTITNLNGFPDGNGGCTDNWSPTDDWHYTGGAIPLPPNTQAEEGGDGHLSIVSADRHTAYDFWQASYPDTVTAPGGAYQINGGRDPNCSNQHGVVIAQIDLLGRGYATPTENSARGSGVPLADTSTRGVEVYAGIFHALGITADNDVAAAPNFDSPPASKSDGGQDSTHIHYGARICLDHNYAETGSIGRINVIRALKQYGAFIVDRQGSFEIDAFSPYDPGGFYAAAGFTSSSLSDIHASNFAPCA